MGELVGNILLSILAILLPPVAAILKAGCTKQFWLNLILTLLVWIPGVIHALWLIWAGPSTL